MKKIAIIHLGAREYYSIPRMLLESGHDVRVFTDIYRKGVGRFLAPISTQIARRYHPDLPACRVHHTPLLSWQYSYARKNATSADEMEAVFHQYGKQFALLCLPELRRFAPDVIVSFSTTAAEIFQEFNGKAKLILNQIDGGIEEDRIVQREREKYPEWEEPAAGVLEIGNGRHGVEQQLADTIVVNSPFSKKCLTLSGVDQNKISIVPLAYDIKSDFRSNHNKRGDKVKLIFLGTVCLRKGIHYLDQALDSLSATGFDFDLTIAGPSNLKPSRLEELKRKYRYLGVISKDQIPGLLAGNDILVLPSIAEGFGMVQLEAIAAGCRVLTTTNAGEVVNDDVLGKICEPYSPEQIAALIRQIAQDMSVSNREDFAKAAALRLKDFSIQSVSARWQEVVEKKF
ncbi:MAG: glycosyltransferase family 4 protein [Verrucomicrobiota bacterium]|nr:glycosyltransferase family 4 protein [Verrucomicrobiota bacterium]